MAEQQNYRIKRHISYQGSRDSNEPQLHRAQSVRVQNPLLSQYLQPASGPSQPPQDSMSIRSVQQSPELKMSDHVFRHASHLRPITGGQGLVIPILPEVTIVQRPGDSPYKQLPSESRRTQPTKQPDQPIEQILYESRKSSTSSARDHKERMRESMERDVIAETRIIPDANRNKIESTPQTADKFWKEALKESHVEVHYDRGDMPEEVPQVFRYCFACENSILEYNIAHHQKVCPGFGDILNKSVQQISRMLDYKIDRISKIMREYSSSSQNPQKGVVPCINDLLTQYDKILKKGNHTIHWEFESKFMQVEACWTDMKMLELAHRLRWFMRIREQISDKYGI